MQAESDSPLAGADEFSLELRSYFVRSRNALAIRGDFSKLFVEYYLHLADADLHPTPEDDSQCKELLAAAALHAASRPRNETAAWTVHRPVPPANFFVNVDNPRGGITGAFFTENIVGKERGLFYADVVVGGGSPRRSVADFDCPVGFPAAGAFFRQSEQRPTRFFRHHDDDFVLLAAQPDCDTEWLAGIDEAAIRTLDADEPLALLEIRKFRWFCGCDTNAIAALLLPTLHRHAGELFGEADAVTVRCPRCGRRHRITRESLEALSSSR